MKNIFIVLVLCFACTIGMYAQNSKFDNIIFKTGEEISCTVKEVTPAEIKYINESNPEGPIVIVPKSTVFMIQYSNGSKELFSTKQNTIENSNTVGIVNSYKGRVSDDPNAQEFGPEDLKKKGVPFIYYGLDFTLIRLVGSSGFTDPANIVDHYFGSINQQIASERDKYDFARTFKISNFNVDLDMLSDVNRGISPFNIVTNSSHSLNEQEVKDHISGYNPKDQDGIGLVIVMETWNKFSAKATMYFVFFDVKTKKTLLLEKLDGQAGGFGIRNYWMKPVYLALKKMEYKF